MRSVKVRGRFSEIRIEHAPDAVLETFADAGLQLWPRASHHALTLLKWPSVSIIQSIQQLDAVLTQWGFAKSLADKIGSHMTRIRRRLLGGILLIAAVGTLGRLAVPGAPAPPSHLLSPPFVRKWTVLAGENTFVVAVAQGIVYYRSDDGVGAIDLNTGRILWNNGNISHLECAVLQGGSIYAIAAEGRHWVLAAIDTHTHQRRNLAIFDTRPQYVAANPQTVYVLDQSGILRAFNLNTAKSRWTRRLFSVPSLPLVAELRVAGNVVYAALGDVGEFALDANTGTVLWKHNGGSPAVYPPSIAGDRIISQDNELRCCNLHTGKELWKSSLGIGAVPVLGEEVISQSDEQLIGLDLRTGRELWRVPLSSSAYLSNRWPSLAALWSQVSSQLQPRSSIPPFANTDDPHPITDGSSVWIMTSCLVSVSKSGKIQWVADAPFAGMPVFANQTMAVTVDSYRIFGYTAGTLPAVPRDPERKKALAQRLTAQFEVLDDAERRQLLETKPFTFRPLISRYVEWAQKQETARNGWFLFDLLKSALQPLRETCGREDTAALMEACEKLKGHEYWKSLLEEIMQAKGDPSGYIPTLVKELRARPAHAPGDYAALEAVAHSSHPDALAFLLAALRDPKARPDWRAAAFVHLAGVGGQEGVQAVRTARPKPGPRKPLLESIDLAHLNPADTVSVRTDSKGRTWMLFHSAVLGNHSDLFIAEKNGGTWSKPIFTGAWTDHTFHTPAPTQFRGIAMSRLIARDWIKTFPDDPSLLRDTDHDGLPDILEQRLGIDPTRAHSDGDGVPDAVDPCPNAAPRPLGDTEKIIAVCIDARFFDANWGVPAILSIPGIRPFEICGYSSTLLWESSGTKLPLQTVYGGGVNVISFSYPDNGLPPLGANIVQFSLDHQTAHTIISRSSDGLNAEGEEATLKKFGDDWIVTDIQTRWVS